MAKKILSFILVACLCFACVLSIAESMENEVISIQLSESELIMNKGKTKTLKTTFEPQNAKRKGVTWESTDKSVAIVSNGEITAKGKGTCDIICTSKDDDNVKAVCHVTVLQPVQTVSINESNVVLLMGSKPELATASLTYSVAPENADWQDVIWTSNHEDIVAVDENGEVTAKQPGKATITATSTDPSGNKAAKITITVNQAVESITLDSSEIMLPVKKTATVKAVVQPDTATSKKVQWSSSDESIVSVSSNGQVTAKACGKAIVTATATDGSGITASYTIEVVQPVKAINVEDKKVALAPETAWRQSFAVTPEDATVKDIKWSSTNDSVAIVDEEGNITGVDVGECKIIGEAIDGSGVKVNVQVSVFDYDVILDSIEPVRVDFDTVEMTDGAYIQVGNRVWGDFDLTTVTFTNGCVTSDSNRVLKAMKPGTEKIVITVKHNGRTVINKTTYTAYVTQDAMSRTESEFVYIGQDYLDEVPQNVEDIVFSQTVEEGELVFRGIPWGVSFTETKPALAFANAPKPKVFPYNTYLMARYDDPGIDVAGYNVEMIRCYYVFDFDDEDEVVGDEDNCQFYKAEYELVPGEEVKENLKEKLTILYGEPSQESLYGAIALDVWHGANDTKISLTGGSAATILRYEWSAGTDYEAKLESFLDEQEKLREEEEEQAFEEENASNFNGL